MPLTRCPLAVKLALPLSINYFHCCCHEILLEMVRGISTLLVYVFLQLPLMGGSSPGLEILLKHCLHEVKALFDSQAYLKNPSAPEAVAAQHKQYYLMGYTYNFLQAHLQSYPLHFLELLTEQANYDRQNINIPIPFRGETPNMPLIGFPKPSAQANKFKDRT
jgi:hypothetical protein